MRAGRKPGRADIADHLAAADMLAAPHRDAAHMAIAGAKAAAVIELYIIAEAAGAAGHRHRDVGRGVYQRALAARAIDAGVHARMEENRRGPPPRDRSEESSVGKEVVRKGR